MSLSWIAVLSFSLQVYFDFSGYSDMAIGLGKMFGFRLPVNFNYPYISKSIGEFWSRWHITLTTWFREYVYYSLGVRVSNFRLYLNVLIVFFFNRTLAWCPFALYPFWNIPRNIFSD
jgi:alginate O-acetyltransferase complex protein AlgI